MSKKEDIKYLRDQIEQRLNGCTPDTLSLFDQLELRIRQDEIDEIKSKVVKETSFTNETGMICLAYIIPAAVLDPEEMTDAHKKLVAWALLGSMVRKATT